MGLWSKFFGAGDAVNETVDAIISTGDALVYTDEEKAKYKLELLKTYEPFKLVQRYLVLLFTVPYVLLHSVVIVGCIYGMEWKEVSTIINDAFGYPVLAAVSLYLTGGIIPAKFK